MCKALCHYSSQEGGTSQSDRPSTLGLTVLPENKKALKHWTASPLLSLHKGTGGDGH